MNRLTLCIIARDEEAMIGGCLDSVRGVVDAIVLVDTGSKDRTVEIAREHGATIVEHPWCDDFAAARNAALPHVNDGFVLMLDADERLGHGARKVLRRALERNDFDCGVLPLHDAATLDAKPEDVLSGRARRGEPMLLPRLLRRTPDLAWEGIVHEQVTSWALRHRRIVQLDAPIVHYGAVPSLREARSKNERNRKLLERRAQIEPHNPTVQAYLARELERCGDVSGAIRAAEAAWSALQVHAEGARPDHDVVMPATLLGFLHVRAKNPARALEVLDQARGWCDPHPNLGLLAGWAHEQLALAASDVDAFSSHLTEAHAALTECVALAGKRFLAECMPGASTFTGQTRLGTVCLLAGDWTQAETAFRAALTTRQDHIEARLGLAETLLDSGRAEKALAELQPALRPELPDAWLLGSAIALALGSEGDARAFLDRCDAALESHAWIGAYREGRRRELEHALRPSLVRAARVRTPRTVSVVIPCFNRFDLLEPVLKGFAKEASHSSFELIAVDDGSQPPLAPFFASLGLPASFRVISRERNGGRGAALNTGLDHATGDVVIFCDSDIVPTEGFVRDHLRFHQESADELATALGGLDWGVEPGTWGAWMGARSNPRMDELADEVDWTHWFTDNWSFRRELLTSRGLRFDPAYRAWGWEELDLARTLAKLGARNVRLTNARGLHLKASTCEGMLQSFERSVPNLLHLAEKHPDATEVAQWLGVGAEESTLDAARALLLELVRHSSRLGAAAQQTALGRSAAKGMADLAFRIGIARGLAKAGRACSKNGDSQLVCEAAATATRVGLALDSAGLYEASGAIAEALEARLGPRATERAVTDRVAWERRQAGAPAAARP